MGRVDDRPARPRIAIEYSGNCCDLVRHTVLRHRGHDIRRHRAPDCRLCARLGTANCAPGFTDGKYWIWRVKGHVLFRITSTAGPNPVIAGIFFGAAGTPASEPPASAATFLAVDTTTQGNWVDAYGRDGYALAPDTQATPPYATVTKGAQSWTWQPSTTDVRALVAPAGTARKAATWYGPQSFTIDVNIPMGRRIGSPSTASTGIPRAAHGRWSGWTLAQARSWTVKRAATTATASTGCGRSKGHVVLRLTLTSGRYCRHLLRSSLAPRRMREPQYRAGLSRLLTLAD